MRRHAFVFLGVVCAVFWQAQLPKKGSQTRPRRTQRRRFIAGCFFVARKGLPAGNSLTPAAPFFSPPGGAAFSRRCAHASEDACANPHASSHPRAHNPIGCRAFAQQPLRKSPPMRLSPAQRWRGVHLPAAHVFAYDMPSADGRPPAKACPPPAAHTARRAEHRPPPGRQTRAAVKRAHLAKARRCRAPGRTPRSA